MNSTRKVFIDLPDGEPYGFPRELPSHVEPKDLEDWIVDCGYPKSKMLEYGERFVFTCWLGD